MLKDKMSSSLYFPQGNHQGYPMGYQSSPNGDFSLGRPKTVVENSESQHGKNFIDKAIQDKSFSKLCDKVKMDSQPMSLIASKVFQVFSTMRRLLIPKVFASAETIPDVPSCHSSKLKEKKSFGLSTHAGYSQKNPSILPGEKDKIHFVVDSYKKTRNHLLQKKIKVHEFSATPHKEEGLKVRNLGTSLVNDHDHYGPFNPQSVPLTNGKNAIAYNFFSKDDSLEICTKIYSPDVKRVEQKFIINRNSTFNQYNYQLAPLDDGRFVITYLSEELKRSINSRIANPTGYIQLYDTNNNGTEYKEFLIDTSYIGLNTYPVSIKSIQLRNGDLFLVYTVCCIPDTIYSIGVYGQTFTIDKDSLKPKFHPFMVSDSEYEQLILSRTFVVNPHTRRSMLVLFQDQFHFDVILGSEFKPRVLIQTESSCLSPYKRNDFRTFIVEIDENGRKKNDKPRDIRPIMEENQRDARFIQFSPLTKENSPIIFLNSDGNKIAMLLQIQNGSKIESCVLDDSHSAMRRPNAILLDGRLWTVSEKIVGPRRRRLVVGKLFIPFEEELSNKTLPLNLRGGVNREVC